MFTTRSSAPKRSATATTTGSACSQRWHPGWVKSVRKKSLKMTNHAADVRYSERENSSARHAKGTFKTLGVIG